MGVFLSGLDWSSADTSAPGSKLKVVGDLDFSAQKKEILRTKLRRNHEEEEIMEIKGKQKKESRSCL